MIKSFRHKGLKQLFLTGSTKGVQSIHAARLRWMLNHLDTAVRLEDMNFPGSDLHPLKGKLKGCWAVKVNANWRLIFRFEDGQAYEVDYDDYH